VAFSLQAFFYGAVISPAGGPMRALIFFLLILLSIPSARAGYDKTAWGMSLKKVSSIYPGGYKENQQAGGYIYSVVRAVGGLSKKGRQA
jgi:hypothetical protein